MKYSKNKHKQMQLDTKAKNGYSGTSIFLNMAELAFLWKKISKKGKLFIGSTLVT